MPTAAPSAGVLGVRIFSDEFEELVRALCRAVAGLAGGRVTDTLHVPPVIDRDVLRTGGYYSSFPDLVGGVVAFHGDDRDHARIIGASNPHEAWAATATATDVVLSPAACYFVYPLCAQDFGREREFTVVGRCYRHEPSTDPMRLRSFRMCERVRVGTEDRAREHVENWADVGLEFLTSLGLPVAWVAASDPFFGRTGALQTANQLKHGLKSELVWSGPDGPVALMSVNYHQTHFGATFGIRFPDGEPAHSGCAAFGIERVALALTARHGPDLTTWPRGVRGALGLSHDPDRKAGTR